MIRKWKKWKEVPEKICKLQDDNTNANTHVKFIFD